MGSCIGRKTDVHIIPVAPNQRFGQNNTLLDNWSEQQVRLLNHKFKEYKTTEGLDYSGFEKLITDSSYLPKPVIKNIFKQFSLSGFEVLNFRNFCILIAQIFLSNKQQKSELIFNSFNENKSDTWTELEKNTFINSYRNFLKNSQKSADFSYTGGLKAQDFVSWACKNLDMRFIMKPFELIPSPDREKAVIYSAMHEMKPSEGLSICLVSSIWWEAWKAYVNYDRQVELAQSLSKSINNGDRPVAIDNSNLLMPSNSQKLKMSVRADKDYVIVSEFVWKTLHEWYDGGPKIARNYIMNGKNLVVELHPPVFHIIQVQNNGHPASTHHVLQFSIKQKFQDVLEAAAKVLKKPADKSRLWLKTKGVLELANTLETIDQVKNFEDEILFETLTTDRGKSFWPRSTLKDKIVGASSNTMTSSPSNSEDSKRNTEIKKINLIKLPKAPGLAGLINLENTCYFNCIIQSLIHTPLLQNFFTTSNILPYLKKSVNPNKCLAVELSDLCKEVWSGNASRLNPQGLYKEFTQRFSMFNDKNQHDCHEFLSMFLDALHEELRREGEEELKTTVILENPENRFVEVEEAQKQWELLQGNQGSFITDLFAGQTKTTLTCTSCGSTRILFEIFTNLSLPIPLMNSIAIYVTIVPLATHIVKIALIMSRERKVKDILDEISSFSGIPLDNIILFDVEYSYSLVFKIYDNSPESSLSSLGVVSKVELFAVEGRKTVKSCEEQGKRVTAYEIQGFSINSQVDILYSPGKWVPGKIKDINGESYLVEYDYIEGKDWKRFDQLRAFRSMTPYIDPTVYTVFLINVSSNSRKKLGFPLALTIGSWYTQEDLLNFTLVLVNKFCSKDLKPTKDPFRITLIDPKTNRCGICRDSSVCSGCSLTRSKVEVRSLFMNTRKLMIQVLWEEKFFSEEVKHDSSVLAVKEKEKAMSKAVDIEMCLNEFTQEEKLEMKCEKCSNNSMKMKMEIWKTPDILILSFKRFTFSGGIIEKIDTLVNFPFSDFEISQFVKSAETSKSALSTSAGHNLYNLYAIVLHKGSVSSGHYTSLIKFDTNWILFDDDILHGLKESPENSSLLSSSYLLMYRRKQMSSRNLIYITDPI